MKNPSLAVACQFGSKGIILTNNVIFKTGNNMIPCLIKDGMLTILPIDVIVTHDMLIILPIDS